VDGSGVRSPQMEIPARLQDDVRSYREDYVYCLGYRRKGGKARK